VERELAISDDHGVAGIVAALIADDVINASSEEVSGFSLAFIAPLGAYKDDCWHGEKVIGPR
jgi:hypothetical protein